MGNPLSYKGRTLTWQGRRLISYGIENKKATYSYDFNNVRTSKTATDGTTSITSKYIYDGNNLIAEQRSVKGPDKDKSVWIYYIYGVDGIAGFNFEDKVYLYRKNVQGDITHIYRKDGNKDLVEVAHYAYDAFGNTEILSETDKIGSLNPFRYRGYYYDIETKLYYLISRYYDPETCRFISADSIEYLDPETLGGLNLYAYCCNNPVMGIDPLGTSTQEFLSLLERIFSSFSGLCNYLVKHPKNVEITWKQFHRSYPNISKREFYRGNSAAINGTKSIGNVLGKIANALAFTALAIDIGLTWRDNYNSGRSSWVTDSLVDTSYIGVKFAIGYGITTLCSMIPIPVIGTLLGIAISVGVNYLIDWIVGETGILNSIKSWAAEVGESIKSGWNYFWSFSWI